MAQRPAFTRPVGLFSCLGTSFPDGFSASLPRRLLLLSPLSAPTGASLSQSQARAQGGTLHPPQELC